MASASPRKKVSVEGLVHSTLGLADPGTSARSVKVVPSKSGNPNRSVSQPMVELSKSSGNNQRRPGSLAMDSGSTSPVQGDRSPLQIARILKQASTDSRTESVFSPESDAPHTLQMQPRQPTGSDWNSCNRSHACNDVVSMTEMLKQLDQQAE